MFSITQLNLLNFRFNKMASYSDYKQVSGKKRKLYWHFLMASLLV
ncbi:hypothetical protein LLB_3048 [Legionella longbeachae D-4968]|nr:hypothetical protein LLB_3048 [Legionella longbeachae D-4968]